MCREMIPWPTPAARDTGHGTDPWAGTWRVCNAVRPTGTGRVVSLVSLPFFILGLVSIVFYVILFLSHFILRIKSDPSHLLS
jgi:hypothetical protein